MILFPAHPFPNFANSPFETPVTEKKMIFLIKIGIRRKEKQSST